MCGGAYRACSVCQPRPPKLLCPFCLAPIQDTHWHPHSCVCHTWHSAQNEDATIIRIYLHPHMHVLSGHDTTTATSPFSNAPAVTAVCRGDEIFVVQCVPSLFVMSNMALAFLGAISSSVTSLLASLKRQLYQQHAFTLRRNHRHTCIHIQKRSLQASPLDSHCVGAEVPLHKVKKCPLLHSVFLSLSFEHVCPDLVQVTSPNGVKLRPRG